MRQLEPQLQQKNTSFLVGMEPQWQPKKVAFSVSSNRDKEKCSQKNQTWGKKFEDEFSRRDKGTSSGIHEECLEFGRMFRKKLQEFAIMLIKKYHYNFPAKYFDDYRQSFNKDEFLKMEQPKEKLRRWEANSLPTSNKEWNGQERLTIMTVLATIATFVGDSVQVVWAKGELKEHTNSFGKEVLDGDVFGVSQQDQSNFKEERDADGTTQDQANPIKGSKQSYIASTETDPKVDELGLAVRKKQEVEKRHSFDGILVPKQAELSLTWDKIGNKKVKTTLARGKLRDIAKEAKGFAERNTTSTVVLFFTSTSKSKLLSLH